MKVSRVVINLNFKTFLKSLFLKIKNKDRENAIKRFKELTGKKYINLVGMCRTGLILTLDYLKKTYPKKNEVIVFAYNLPEFIEIIKNNGFKIKLVDISENGTPLISDIKKKINSKTSALLFTNMFNDFQYLQNLKKICQKKKILLIEDCAITLGNYHKKNKRKFYTGSVADISLYSFGIMKNLCAIYGGAITTNNEKIEIFISKQIKNLNKFSNIIYLKKIILFIILKICLSKFIFSIFFNKLTKHAHKTNNLSLLKIFYPSLNFKQKKTVPNYYKSRIHPIAEKIFINLIISNKLERDFETRRSNNLLYSKYLKSSKSLKIINISDSNFQNYLEFHIITNKKKLLIKKLLNENFDFRIFYYYDCSFFKKKNVLTNYKNSKIFEKNIICLPNHYKINKNYIIKISKILNNI